MTRPDLDAILPRVSAEDESIVDALLAKAREGVGKRPIGGRPSLDAIRARLLHPNLTAEEFESIMAILAYIDELERRTTYTVGETEWAQRIAVAEQRFVDEYDARRDVERQRDELLRVNKGAARHGIITEHVRKLIELLGIQRQNPTANETVDAAATEIETLRTTVEELKARITTLEAMKP